MVGSLRQTFGHCRIATARIGLYDKQMAHVSPVQVMRRGSK
jgi:hypothetical protein